MRYLKTNTATIVTVGPFYDKTDGVTIETALTITNERITFVVDNNDGSAPTLVLDNVTGATSGTSNDLNYITSNDAGLMQLELAAANVNYLGRAMLTITDAANHCPVFHEFMILPAMVFDSLIAGTVSDKTGYALSSAGVQAIWDALTSTLTAVGSVGKRIADNLDATISSRGTSTYAGGDTSGTTTLLSRIVGTLATGTHNPQTGDAYARLGAPAGASVSADIADVPTVAEFNARTLTAAEYVVFGDLPSVPSAGDNATAAAAAILVTPANKLATNATGQAEANLQSWRGETPLALSSGKVITYPDGTLLRYELGMAARNLDTQLGTIDNFLDTEMAAVKAVTDKLDTALVLDGAVYDFTAAALAAAPSGSGGDATAANQAAILAALADVPTDVDTELTASHGAGVWGAAGSGLLTDTITIDDGTDPLDGVLVQVATDSAFSNIIRSGYTNGLGQVTFHYDAAGTYYGRAEIAAFNVRTFGITVS